MSQEEKKSEEGKFKTTTGGFKVKQATRQPIGEAVEEGLAAEEGGVQEVAVNENDMMVGGMLVESASRMIGKTMELLTRIPEMNFDEEEIEQLKMAWGPLMPSISPVFGAIIVTITIASGKAAVYKIKKKEVKAIERKGFEDEE